MTPKSLFLNVLNVIHIKCIVKPKVFTFNEDMLIDSSQTSQMNDIVESRHVKKEKR